MKYIILLSFILFFSCQKEIINSIEDTGSLPKIEIIMDDYHLWSPDSGIYVVGEPFAIGIIIGNTQQ